MSKYRVTGLYTISFEMEVEANSREEAEEMGEELVFEEEWNGKSVFTDKRNVDMSADGMTFNIEVELIDGKEDEDED